MSSLMTHPGKDKSGLTALIQKSGKNINWREIGKTEMVALEQTGMRLAKTITGVKQHREKQEETCQKW